MKSMYPDATLKATSNPASIWDIISNQEINNKRIDNLISLTGQIRSAV